MNLSQIGLQMQVTPLATKRFPYKVYYFTVSLIVLIGLLDSVYLTFSHYRNFVDMEYQSFCAISRSFNCDTVSQSPYAIFLGVPVPVWGILGYGLFLFLLSFSWNSKAEQQRVWTLLFFISLIFSLYSLVLAFISSYFIHSYCAMCILSYAVNLVLLFCAWIIRRRFGAEPVKTALCLDIRYLLNFRKTFFPGLVFFMVTAVAMIWFFPSYWHLKPPPLSVDVSTGVTEDGHPWIGAENPELTIVEFSDYQCFQCRKMHFYFRRMVLENPDKIRLVHRHFPMDARYNPLVEYAFHVGSGNMSTIALYAQIKGQFWKVNDYLFELAGQKKNFNTATIAEQMDVNSGELVAALKSRALRLRLKHDIAVGLNYGIKGTPSFVVGEKVYLGQIPAELLRPYLK
ncbi:hypothetical protein DSCO28_00670 [Desulfosarcina ovata subsp. sediminis]|uniref:Vitamin K epoxide reductase domain-containing protein n=1 Tax=Desulfosarcina ovata subsp. sediminis TaxID=885957 RepID=A0A5K7ZF11_9BACT|nr:vitamin K epoxide reductase family protein [Desulfosarcina ovata]BBO79501.1 hypothetical protein DSCO28_00670 [Desulfosarcina ovata subsp. sediminis]